MTILSAFVGAGEPNRPEGAAGGPPLRPRWRRRRQRGEVTASSTHVREQP
ncbi:hypothetical protein [Streptomyces monashensis]|nr:hypothetical protein [Streptomyces monashensis]